MGIPVDKFVSNHAKLMLKGIKNMKIDRWKKTRKPMIYNKGHFDTVQSDAPQLVSWSFMMNLNSEFTWKDVKKYNWKLKICIFFPPSEMKIKMKRVKLRPWCLRVSHWNIFQWAWYLTCTQKGNIDYTLYFFFAHFHNFLWKRQIWWLNADLNYLQWLGKGSTNEFTIFVW